MSNQHSILNQQFLLQPELSYHRCIQEGRSELNQRGHFKSLEPFLLLPIQRFYGYKDDDDEDEDDNSAELQDLPRSTECESFIHPAKELNLLLPKSLPLLRTSSTVVERNGKAIVREVKEGYSLNDLPGGYMGKMLVYKSDKVKMKLGDALFDVNLGTDCGMTQHVVAINTKQRHCCELVEIENRHVVVTPDVDSVE